MLTILSTLISFLMGGLPKLLDFFQDRADKKHELALAQMQIERELELRKAGFEAQERRHKNKTTLRNTKKNLESTGRRNLPLKTQVEKQERGNAGTKTGGIARAQAQKKKNLTAQANKTQRPSRMQAKTKME